MSQPVRSKNHRYSRRPDRNDHGAAIAIAGVDGSSQDSSSDIQDERALEAHDRNTRDNSMAGGPTPTSSAPEQESPLEIATATVVNDADEEELRRRLAQEQEHVAALQQHLTQVLTEQRQQLPVVEPVQVDQEAPAEQDPPQVELTPAQGNAPSDEAGENRGDQRQRETDSPSSSGGNAYCPTTRCSLAVVGILVLALVVIVAAVIGSTSRSSGGDKNQPEPGAPATTAPSGGPQISSPTTPPTNSGTEETPPSDSRLTSEPPAQMPSLGSVVPISWKQLGSDLKGEAANDEFGKSVALSADAAILAVGAIGNDSRKGQVRVFLYSSSIDQWTKLGTDLDGDDTGDYFGWSVALSANGTILAVGAIFNDANGRNNSGHVRVFQYNARNDEWSQLGAALDGEAAGDRFGHHVALSANGKILAVGAIFNDGNGRNNSGHVGVFQNRNTNSRWNQLGADLEGEAAGDQFGSSVALSADGTTLAVGAVYNGDDSGHVRVFRYSGIADQWIQRGADLDGMAAGDYFGSAVSLSADGSTLAVGAILHGGKGNEESGRVQVFRYIESTGTWQQLGSDLDGQSPGDRLGISLSLSADGKILAVGGYLSDGKNTSDTGHVGVYQFNSRNSQWNQLGFDLDGEAANDRFGESIALSANGTVVAIGSRHNGGNGHFSGHVRVFRRNAEANTT